MTAPQILAQARRGHAGVAAVDEGDAGRAARYAVAAPGHRGDLLLPSYRSA